MVWAGAPEARMRRRLILRQGGKPHKRLLNNCLPTSFFGMLLAYEATFGRV